MIHFRKTLGQCKTILIIDRQPALIIVVIKKKQRSIARLTDDKCKCQSASWKDLVKKLFQHANKVVFAESLILNVLNASSHLTSILMHLLHWPVIFTWLLLGSRVMITSWSILSNNSENTPPLEDHKNSIPGVAQWPQLSGTFLFYPKNNFRHL